MLALYCNTSAMLFISISSTWIWWGCWLFASVFYHVCSQQMYIEENILQDFRLKTSQLKMYKGPKVQKHPFQQTRSLTRR